jgi:hypothetical protein
MDSFKTGQTIASSWSVSIDKFGKFEELVVGPYMIEVTAFLTELTSWFQGSWFSMTEMLMVSNIDITWHHSSHVLSDWDHCFRCATISRAQSLRAHQAELVYPSPLRYMHCFGTWWLCSSGER